MSKSFQFQLPSGANVIIRNPTVKGVRKFIRACAPFIDQDGEPSDSVMLESLFNDFIPMVAEAVERSEAQIEEMDPIDYQVLAQEVIGVYQDFLGRMGDRTNRNSAP